MKEKVKEVFDFINRPAGRSFVEIEEEFGIGNHSLKMKELNVVLWNALTKETVDAIIELMNKKKVMAIPTNPATYLIDGVIPDMEIIDSNPPKNGYKKERWCPACLYSVEYSPLKNPTHKKMYIEDGYNLQ